MGIRLMIEDLKLPMECIGEVSNGEELLELLQLLKPDICFVDIKMPKLNGIAAIKEAKKRHPGSEVYWYILTGVADFEYAREGIKLGVSDYLLKPIGPKEIQKIFEEIQEKQVIKEKELEKVQLIQTNEALEKNIDLVEDIKKFIHQNYMYDIGIGEIATQYNLTTTYVSHIFHKKSGVKFIDYLIQVRMKNAKRIIEINPNLSIKEISEKVGYYSTRHFTKKFFEIYGYNPSELKKTLRS